MTASSTGAAASVTETTNASSGSNSDGGAAFGVLHYAVKKGGRGEELFCIVPVPTICV